MKSIWYHSCFSVISYFFAHAKKLSYLCPNSANTVRHQCRSSDSCFIEQSLCVLCFAFPVSQWPVFTVKHKTFGIYSSSTVQGSNLIPFSPHKAARNMRHIIRILNCQFIILLHKFLLVNTIQVFSYKEFLVIVLSASRILCILRCCSSVLSWLTFFRAHQGEGRRYRQIRWLIAVLQQDLFCNLVFALHKIINSFRKLIGIVALQRLNHCFRKSC